MLEGQVINTYSTVPSTNLDVTLSHLAFPLASVAEPLEGKEIVYATLSFACGATSELLAVMVAEGDACLQQDTG